MTVSNADFSCMIFLDCIETGSGIPDGCDIDALAAQGLVECLAERWSLTPRGQLHLHMLRACESRRDVGE